MNKALLPAGFHDLLFPEAGVQADIVTKLSKYFESFGYFMVSPPVIEFEESLFAGAGKALETSTFRLMDPLSHNMMGVRADITVQIARIATTRLKNEPLPIRLSYAGDVFRVKGEGLYAERQFTQAGIELIGVDNVQADAEVISVALDALKEVGVADLCIDFTIPNLAEIILGDGASEPLLAAIRRKDAASIKKLGGKQADLLIKLVAPDITLAALEKIKLPKEASSLVERFCEVVNLVKERTTGVNISVDPIAALNFSYHTAIGFSIFSKKAKGELARGGRYIIDDKILGIGVTLYVNELFRILPKAAKHQKVFVPLGVEQKQIEKLRKDGLVVINALAKSKDEKKEAKRLGCAFVWDGKLVKL